MLRRKTVDVLPVEGAARSSGHGSAMASGPLIGLAGWLSDFAIPRPSIFEREREGQDVDGQKRNFGTELKGSGSATGPVDGFTERGPGMAGL